MNKKRIEEADQDDEVICFCSGTTRAKVKQLIADGADSVDRISRITGAVSGCAGCEYPMQELLATYALPKPSEPGDA